jgi:hypothetical protein
VVTSLEGIAAREFVAVRDQWILQLREKKLQEQIADLNKTAQKIEERMRELHLNVGRPEYEVRVLAPPHAK